MAPFSKGRFPPGKKGMRQNNGKKPSIRLKPRPNASNHASATTAKDATRDGKDRETDEDDCGEQLTEQEDDEDELKPLNGVNLTVSGCGQDKTALLDLAEQLGAVSDINMTHQTTHLITDSVGSQKYEMAVKRRFKIMQPSWLEAVRQRWTSAEPLDLDQIYEEHRFKPFQGLVLSLTQFQSGAYKKELMLKLAELGADVRNKLHREATHLVVASPSSPHSPQQNLTKIETALQLQADFPRLVIVWEKWLHEVMNLGGQLKERQDFWTWQRGMTEPEAEPLETYPLDEKSNSRKRLLPQNSTVMQLLGDKDDPLMPAHKKAKTRSGLNEANDVEALLQRYQTEEAGPSFFKAPERPKGMVVEMRAEGMALGARSKSVIKALATSKSAVITTANESTKSIRPIKQLKPKPAAAADPTASAKDDSAFFEEVSEIVDDHTRILQGPVDEHANSTTISDYSLPKLKGVKIWLGLRDRVLNEKGGEMVRDMGGETVDRMQDADRLVVDVHGPWPAVVDLADERLRTAAWFDHYMNASDPIHAEACPLARPLLTNGPIADAGKLKLQFSLSYVDESQEARERLHMKEFVQHYGFRYKPDLRTTVTHYVHPDPDATLNDPRMKEMKRYGIKTVDMNWLRRWIVEHRDEGESADAAVAAENIVEERKVKEELEQLETRNGMLNGCRLMFTPKISSSERHRLIELALELGATHVKDIEDDPTHLIHVGPRLNDPSATVKQARKSGTHVVHPAWIEKCHADNSRLNEAEFPHTLDPKKGLQLNGFVSSQDDVNQELSAVDEGAADDVKHLQPARREAEEKTSRRPSPVVLESMTNIHRAATTTKTAEARRRSVTRSPSPSRDPADQAAAVAALQSAAQGSAGAVLSPRMSPIARVDRSSRDNSPDQAQAAPSVASTRPTAELAKSGAAAVSKTLLKEQTSLLLAQLAKESSESKSTRLIRKRPQKSSNGASPAANAAAAAAATFSTSPFTAPVQPFIRPAPLPNLFGDSLLDSQTQTVADESLYVRFEDPDEVRAREAIRQKLQAGGNNKGKVKSPAKLRNGGFNAGEGSQDQTLLRRSSRKSR
ncbi:hypothetical protein ACM66B_006612 [Microbotryomycetes sp. NB124-2]